MLESFSLMNKEARYGIYKCPDEDYGCEVTVTKGAPEDCKSEQNPTCCCGKIMEKN